MCQVFLVGNGNANYEWSEREKVRASLELLMNYLDLKEVSWGTRLLLGVSFEELSLCIKFLETSRGYLILCHSLGWSGY